jgi:GGDEF domain-containing protein
MAPDAPRRRRARPVADAPIDGLLAATDELAKGWVLALLEAVPLHEAPGLITEPLTRDGPRICDAALRALADDSDLRRLEPAGALRRLAGEVGEMTAARSPSAVARTVDALHDVLWSALCDELRGPDARLVGELSARLAQVCGLIREAALERLEGPGDGPPGAGSGLAALPAREPGAPEVGGEHPEADPPAGPASADATAGSPAADAPAGSPAADAPAADRWSPPAATVAGASTGIALWQSALSDEIRIAGSSARPLSLLLAEIDDAERVLASAPAERAAGAFDDFVAALRRVLRRHDILVWESQARAWVIARETSRAGAHALGARIAEAVGETSALSGAPLVASVGVAILGEDGTSSEELMEAAEEARFRAAARGIEVSRRVPDRDRRGG